MAVKGSQLVNITITHLNFFRSSRPVSSSNLKIERLRLHLAARGYYIS